MPSAAGVPSVAAVLQANKSRILQFLVGVDADHAYLHKGKKGRHGFQLSGSFR